MKAFSGLIGSSLVCALAVVVFAGCESIRPGTLTTTGTRFEEANKTSLLDEYRWQSWPTVELGLPEHAQGNRHNWRGPLDSSGFVAVEVYGDRLTFAGRIIDDQPLQQPFEKPSQPAWMRVPFAGDGIVVRFVPDEERAKPVTMLVSFGSAGINPELTVLECERGEPGPVPGAAIRWIKTPLGMEFLVRSVKMDEYGLRPFWSMGYTVEVTLHDYDGLPSAYSALKHSVKTKPQE